MDEGGDGECSLSRWPPSVKIVNWDSNGDGGSMGACGRGYRYATSVFQKRASDGVTSSKVNPRRSADEAEGREYLGREAL